METLTKDRDDLGLQLEAISKYIDTHVDPRAESLVSCALNNVLSELSCHTNPPHNYNLQAYASVATDALLHACRLHTPNTSQDCSRSC